MNRHSSSTSYEAWEIEKFRSDPGFALEYLNAAFEVAFKENDPQLILTSLAVLAKAFGIKKVAAGTGVRRESLHRMLSKRGNPEWTSMFRVLRALNLRPRFESLGRPV